MSYRNRSIWSLSAHQAKGIAVGSAGPFRAVISLAGRAFDLSARRSFHVLRSIMTTTPSTRFDPASREVREALRHPRVRRALHVTVRDMEMRQRFAELRSGGCESTMR